MLIEDGGFGWFNDAKEEILPHARHKLTVAWYGVKANPVDISIECLTCGEVLITFPRPAEQE